MPAYHGKGLRMKVYLEGGPAMAAALAKLEKGTRDELLKEATKDGAEVIAVEWRTQAQARIGYGPGTAHFVEAIEARSRAGKNGATGLVSLKKVSTSPGEAQPIAYAKQLEFGGKPTLRPAFDASRDRAVKVMEAKLKALIERAV
jgi:hypothetical protein